MGAAAAAVPIVGGIMGGMAQIAGSRQQASAYESQAAEYRQQQREAVLQAKSDEANRYEAYNRVIGSSKVFAAAGNVGVDSPSMEALRNANTDTLSRSISYTEATKDMAVTRMEAAAQGDEQAAKAAIAIGYLQAGATMMGAGGQAASLMK